MPSKNGGDLFDEVKKKSADRILSSSWYNKLSKEQLQEIKDSFNRCKAEGIPTTVLAEVIKEKYKLNFSKDSILRAIIRRIV